MKWLLHAYTGIFVNFLAMAYNFWALAHGANVCMTAFLLASNTYCIYVLVDSRNS